MSKKIKNSKSAKLVFPISVVTPVAHFLSGKLHDLQEKKRDIDKEDPFKDNSRVMDNASPDAEAAEQFGHAKSSAIKQEIDRKIVQVRKALTQIKLGKYGVCEDCGNLIDTDRLVIYPEATRCVSCEKKREK